MFQRILVPLDGSSRAERAIPVAARLAQASGGSVTLLGVVTSPIDQSPLLRQEALDADREKLGPYLESVARSKDLAGVETKTEVLDGIPAEIILAVANVRQKMDLIVMCSHGYTGFKRWALGSVAQKIARHSPIPLLVLREGGDAPTNIHLDGLRPVRVLVALDGSPLAEATLVPAAHLSMALSTPLPGMLHLTRVVPWLPMEDNRENEMVTAARVWAESDAKAYLEHVEQRLREGELAGLNLSITTSVAVHADIAETLIRMTEDRVYRDEIQEFDGCDMIALATHGRGGVQRWAVGSVTERLLDATKLPLLIVRPVFGGDNG